jgi:predicted ATPase/DNA-binding CsgD family transcriptional regulator
MLRRPNVRLLTLVGPPGIGKTRLSIQVAGDLLDHFLDGVCYVPLAPVRDPDLVVPTIAQMVGVMETADQPLLQGLKSYFRDKNALLLLDNFEQIVTAAPLLADLLANCPGVKLLVTSRELLHLYGEYDYPVPALSLPDPNRLPDPDLEALSQYEAIALFLQRAQAINPGFKLTEQNARPLAGVCVRLDGLPLAIELAAARILVLPPDDLLARLISRLKLLTGGARNLPERHRTLRAAIDWSYNLLDPGEQILFRRIGVFVGGCALEAVVEVCGSSQPGEPEIDMLEGVTSLVGKSLLQRQEGVDGGPRLIMLETIREYAREKFEESGELDSISDRHFDYFLQLAEHVERKTPGNETALRIGRLDAEQNNLRAALEWSLSQEGRAERGLRLAGALASYWDSRGYFSEGRQWCIQLLSKSAARTEGTQPSIERAKALRALARMTWQLGDLTEAGSLYEQSLEMSRALGDESGVAAALLGLGNVVMWQGEYDISHSLYEECLAIGRRLGDRRVISSALSMIGVIFMRKGEYQAAQFPLDEALAIERELGDGAETAGTLTMQGTVAIHLGEYERAKALIEEGLGIARELRVDWVIAFSLARLGMIALRQGDPKRAEAFLLEGLARAQDSGIRRWSRWYLVGLAEIARLRGQPTRAATLIGASEGLLSAAGAHYEPATSAEIDRIIASVRAELDEDTFEKQWAEGCALPFEKIMAYTGSTTKAGTAISAEGQQAYRGDPSTSSGHALTEREVEVLRLIAEGMSNQEIGQELVLSRRTVERHISNIYQKIGASGKVARATATAYALRHGLAT